MRVVQTKTDGLGAIASWLRFCFFFYFALATYAYDWLRPIVASLDICGRPRQKQSNKRKQLALSR